MSAPSLISALFPPTCLLCGAPGRDPLDLCPGCLEELPYNRYCCPRCALPLPPSAPTNSLCGACQRRPPPFDQCIAPFRYEGAMPHLITGLKFHARMNYARLLGELLAAELPEKRPQLLIPVPLHTRRLRERGFNQAVEIARSLGVPLDLRSCVRKLNTAPHSGLDARERRRNIRGAFVMNVGVQAEHVALIDDVVTTGSTVAELAKVLKRSGVKRVDVWAVARTA